MHQNLTKSQDWSQSYSFVNFRLSSSDQDYSVVVGYMGSPAVIKEKLVAGTEIPLAYSKMKTLLQGGDGAGDKEVVSEDIMVCYTYHSVVYNYVQHFVIWSGKGRHIAYL